MPWTVVTIFRFLTYNQISNNITRLPKCKHICIVKNSWRTVLKYSVNNNKAINNCLPGFNLSTLPLSLSTCCDLLTARTWSVPTAGIKIIHFDLAACSLYFRNGLPYWLWFSVQRESRQCSGPVRVFGHTRQSLCR